MTPGLPGSKAVVLGLDGVCWSLIERLRAAGTLPNLSALADASICGPMLSTLPEISPVAWTTFFTGRSPAEHGIYGFTEFAPEGYTVRLNSSGDIRVPAIWDWLGLRGGRSVVLNVPLTYPARPLNGVMVSGFISIDYARAAYPAWAAEYLRESGYRLEADFEKVHQDRDAFLDDLDAALNGRGRLLDRFWGGEWDLFVLVVTDTDRLHHFFLREFLENGPITDYFLDFYRRVDELVGRVREMTADLAARIGQEVLLLLLSDHGFAGVKEEFHLNRWLAANGFLDRVGPEAKALALDPTRIYFNRPSRFPEGRVRSADVSELADRITAGLMGEPAVSGVMPGRELFAGPLASLAPDLVVLPAPGYEFKAKFTGGTIYTDSPLQGAHTRDDAFFLIHGGRGDAAEVRDILDLGRYLFSYFNI